MTTTNPLLSRVNLIDVIRRLPRDYRPKGLGKMRVDALNDLVERAKRDPRVRDRVIRETKRLERERRGVEVVR